MNKDSSWKNKAWVGIFVLLIANTTAGGAEWVTASLQDISAHFDSAPYSVITLINNIPNLCAVFMSVIAGLIVNRKIKLRPTLIFTTALWGLGGILPVFTGNSSIYSLLAGRIIYGIAYGIMQGLSIAMVFKLVKKENLRDRAMGWTQSAMYAMGMIAQIIAGILCVKQWNYSFAVYAWGFIPMIILIFMCPKTPLDTDIQREPLGKSLKKLPGVVWVFSILIAVWFCCMYPCMLNLAPIIISNGLGDAATVGSVMVFLNIGAFLGGLIFAPIVKVAKRFQLSFCCVLSMGSCLCFIFGNTLFVLTLGVFLFSLGGGQIVPGAIRAYTDYTDDGSSFMASGLTFAFFNTGAFLSSLYLAVFEVLGKDIHTTFKTSFVVMIILCVVFAVVQFSYAKKREKVTV